MIKANKNSIIYSVVTLAATFIVGQILLWLFPEGNSLGSSLLFILINLFPMIMAAVMSIATHESRGILDFFKKVFVQKESSMAFLIVILIPAIYYGVSALIKNVDYTGAGVFAVLAYLPWTLLQGGLEEVGWRWYLQKHIGVRSFFLRMILISVVWFLWHIPIYRLPWITAGSSNYLIFYLMILGNTFTLGVLGEKTKGAVPCIIAHMLIDALAVLMLVHSNILSVVVLVVIEVTAALLINRLVIINSLKN